MNPHEFLESINAGRFKPAYYFYGEEDYRIVEAEKFLARAFLPDMQRATNYRRLDGRKVSAGDLLAELAGYPMLGERQVIAVANFQSYKPKDVERVLKVLQPADSNRVVVFSSPAGKAPKKKTAFFKTVTSIAAPVEFNKLTIPQSKAIIRAKLSAAKVRIEPSALDLLAELVAGNRGGLEQEVAKLLDYLGGEGTITLDTVRTLSSGYEMYQAFDLADKILNHDHALALAQVERLLAEGQSATGILFFLGQHYIDLYLVQNRKPLASNRRWLERKYRPQCNRLSNEQLERGICLIAEADGLIRRGNLSGKQALEQLVVRLLAETGK